MDGMDHSNLTELSLRDLCDFIVSRHYIFEREHLFTIKVHLNALERMEGARFPQLKKVKRIFDHLREKIDQHVEKERLLLFPLADELYRRQRNPDIKHPGEKQLAPITGLLEQLQMEHGEIRSCLGIIKKLTGDYSLPGVITQTGKLCLLELGELEQDAVRMMEEEERVLFPKMFTVWQQLSARRYAQTENE